MQNIQTNKTKINAYIIQAQKFTQNLSEGMCTFCML